jgi:hypothetical protein
MRYYIVVKTNPAKNVNCVAKRCATDRRWRDVHVKSAFGPIVTDDRMTPNVSVQLD